MESTGAAGRIHISEAMATILRDIGRYEIEECEIIEVMNKGPTNTYYLVGTTDSNQRVSEDTIHEALASVKKLLGINQISERGALQLHKVTKCMDLSAYDDVGNAIGDCSIQTFLVVDDSLVVRKKHQRLLNTIFPGCEVILASDGVEAC